MPAHLLRKSAALFATMMAERQACAAARSAGSRSAADVLADLDAALPAHTGRMQDNQFATDPARPTPLPSLTDVLAARRAIFGAHAAEVTA